MLVSQIAAASGKTRSLIGPLQPPNVRLADRLMSRIKKGRGPTDLWSLQQAAVWIETRRVPEHPIHRRIAPAAVQELHNALMAGTITASGSVDGGERRDILPREWTDYVLTPKQATFSGHHYTGAHGTPVVTILSIRSFPAAALKYHGRRSRVRIPSTASKGGEPAYHRVIHDVLLPREQVVRQWPSDRRSPLPDNRPSAVGSKAGLGAKALGIEQAIQQLWPNGIPQGLSAKDRNRRILVWLKSNGCSVPKSPERAIQRVLKARRSR